MLNSKIWKRYHNIIIFGLLLLLGACVSPLPPPGGASPLNKQTVFKKAPSDTDLVQEGITYLGDAGQSGDYVKARDSFNTLLKTYPESKWRRLSETLIHLIDNIQSCREKDLLADREQENKSRLEQENERLKREIRSLDKLQTEAGKLQQENDQLKKDIQLLKEIEIQLDKREKMLR